MLEAAFTKFTLGELTLENRIVMAPMTRGQAPEHIPTETIQAYYTKRAQGGVGLIITEGVGINHPAAHGYPDVPNCYGKKTMQAWQAIVESVHAHGTKIFPQLWHVGSLRQNDEVMSVAPSAIKHPAASDDSLPHALTESEIADLIEAYVASALAAREAGFDGVEIHAAHGYLIDQFFWAQTNTRTDSYGGDTLAKRTRFAVEVVKAIRHRLGASFPIGLRFSNWKLGAYDANMIDSPQTLEDFLEPLTNAGVNLFHVSTRRFYEAAFEDSLLTLAGWTKKLSGQPSIAVGSIGLERDFTQTLDGSTTTRDVNSLESLDMKLQQGEFDLFAVGRQLIANANWATLCREGRLEEALCYERDMLQAFPN